MRAAHHRMQDERITDLRGGRARPDPIPVTVPTGANAAQRAAFFTATEELRVRCRASKISRGYEVMLARTSPPGTIPVASLIGTTRVLRLCIDLRGALRLIEGTKMGGVTTVSEAVAIARGG